MLWRGILTADRGDLSLHGNGNLETPNLRPHWATRLPPGTVPRSARQLPYQPLRTPARRTRNIPDSIPQGFTGMSEIVRAVTEWCTLVVESLGVLIIIGVAFYSLGSAGMQRLHGASPEPVYQELRLRLGRGILLGLELLVAADIIHTVAVELSFESVGVLAIIVLIRTFLSFALELELTGTWPWQHSKNSSDSRSRLEGSPAEVGEPAVGGHADNS